MKAYEVIQKLKQIGTENPAAHAMFSVWAKRQRARHQVTMQSLLARMALEGYKYEPKDYATVLEILADLGFGTLERGKQGDVVALWGIRTTLQSIGKAAVGESVNFKTFKQRQKYIPLTHVKKQVITPTKQVISRQSMSLTIYINDKPVSIPVPRNLEPSEVADLVLNLQKVAER